MRYEYFKMYIQIKMWTYSLFALKWKYNTKPMRCGDAQVNYLPLHFVSGQFTFIFKHS